MTWGRGVFGQLGHEIDPKTGEQPQSLAIPRPVQSLLQTPIVQVACGWQHTMALTNQGKVYSWGYGEDGQLGHGDSDDIATPELIQSFSNITIDTIACGHSHSAAVCQGELFMWGSNPD